MSPLSNRQTAALRHLCSRCVLSLHNSTDFGVPKGNCVFAVSLFFCQQKFCTNQTKSLKFPAPRMTVAHRHGKSRPSKPRRIKQWKALSSGNFKPMRKSHTGALDGCLLPEMADSLLICMESMVKQGQRLQRGHLGQEAEKHAEYPVPPVHCRSLLLGWSGKF